MSGGGSEKSELPVVGWQFEKRGRYRRQNVKVIKVLAATRI